MLESMIRESASHYHVIHHGDEFIMFPPSVVSQFLIQKKAIELTVLFIASSDGIHRQPCIEMIRDNAPDAVHL